MSTQQVILVALDALRSGMASRGALASQAQEILGSLSRSPASDQAPPIGPMVTPRKVPSTRIIKVSELEFPISHPVIFP